MLRGEHERTRLFGSNVLQVGAKLDEHLGGILVPVIRAVDERSAPIMGCHVDVRSCSHQLAQDLRVPIPSCKVQGGAAITHFCVHISTVRQKICDELLMPTARGEVEGGAAILCIETAATVGSDSEKRE
jgi:hypothetical protein